MAIARRLSLIAFVLAAPPLLTALFYVGGRLLLHATNRVIDPQVLWYAAAVEFAAFFVVAVLDAKSRW